MAAEILSAVLEAAGSALSVTPEKAIATDSKYQITLSGIRSADGSKTFPETTFVIYTAVSPMYCTLSSLKAVTNGFGIPDEVMLSYIRDASKYADFVAGNTSSTASNSTTTTFAKEQFTRTKATYDCLLNAYMSKAQGSGNTYKLGDAEFVDAANSAAFKNLLSGLNTALKYWTDAIRGYYNEGRSKPSVTRLGLKASDNSDVSQITIDTILNDFTRSAVQFS